MSTPNDFGVSNFQRGAVDLKAEPRSEFNAKYCVMADGVATEEVEK